MTRIVVTQTDEPSEEFTAVPGTRWVVEWTKSHNGKEAEFRHALHSIVAARRLVRGLLQARTPGTSRDEVLSLVGFEG